MLEKKGSSLIDDAASLVGGAGELDIPVDGDARIVESSVETIRPEDMKSLAFNEDVLTILMIESQDENAPRLATPMVNGVLHCVMVGEPTRIKRKFVEVLARAKQIRYKQVVKQSDMSGQPVNKMVPRVLPRFNFTVLDDPAGKRGIEWLTGVLADKI